VLLLSRNEAYTHLNKFIVVEITTTWRGIRMEVALGSAEGLLQPSVASFDNLHTIARHRLLRRLGSLHSERWPEAKRALGYALRWPELLALNQ